MYILKYKNVFLGIALLMVLASVFTILNNGFKKSIDFTGGAKVVFTVAGEKYMGYPEESTIAPKDLWKFRNDKRFGLNKQEFVAPTPTESEIKQSLESIFGEVKLTSIGENTYKLQTRDLTEADYAKLQNAIKVNASTTAEIKEFAMTGPSISSEIVKKSVIGFILVVLAIILFIWFSFRGGSGSVSSWKYGVIAIVALVHDITIPAGVFSYLGATQGVEIDALFVVALLTILGISISDTIVIFDRIRENIKGTGKNANFEEVVGKSLDQSMVRSLATSVSVIVVLLALVFYGPESTKYFSIALTIGMFVGTYSSIFVASPLLVLVSKYWKTKN
jgi:preprotein translocase subunit SecF